MFNVPVHITDLTSEVTVAEGEMPLTQKQLEQIADYVVARLRQKEIDAALERDDSEFQLSSGRKAAIYQR